MWHIAVEKDVRSSIRGVGASYSLRNPPMHRPPLTDEEINEYQEVHFEAYGQRISLENARRIATDWIERLEKMVDWIRDHPEFRVPDLEGVQELHDELGISEKQNTKPRKLKNRLDPKTKSTIVRLVRELKKAGVKVDVDKILK